MAVKLLGKLALYEDYCVYAVRVKTAVYTQ
jgi:hypothetical protein